MKMGYAFLRNVATYLFGYTAPNLEQSKPVFFSQRDSPIDAVVLLDAKRKRVLDRMVAGISRFQFQEYINIKNS